MTPPHVLGPPRRHREDRVRLLLVEDELSTVFAMREFFAQAGFDVDCAAGLTEAMALLTTHEFDAVITDLHLTAHRRGEGMNVAWQARRCHPRACIVMLTGFGEEATEDEARRCGVDIYQTKPVELALLCASVDSALNREPGAPRARELGAKWREH